MARKAGSIVLDRLRDRILLGRYFGCWSPGDRLPSVRDVAHMEEVDRKTAAAAYRRLQKERLVRVEPRSGVYLREETREDGAGPLQRLHRQWLEQALSTAIDLGLDSDAVARMIQGVAVVEEHRIPVVDEDREHAALVARELNTRTGLDYGPCQPSDLPALSGPLKDAPFVVATPTAAIRLRPGQRRVPVVPAILAPELIDRVRAEAERGPVTVVVGTAGLAVEIRRALEHGLAGPRDRVSVVRPESPAEAEKIGDTADRILVWPGVPEWAVDRMAGATDELHRSRLLADSTVTQIRQQVARAALDYLNRSNGA